MRIIMLVLALALWAVPTRAATPQITATWQSATVVRVTWQDAPLDARVAVAGVDVGSGTAGTVDVPLPNPPISAYAIVYDNRNHLPYIARALIPPQPTLTATLTTTWTPDHHALIVQWQASEIVCLYALVGSAQVSLQGDLPCRAVGSFTMLRTGDIGYAALSGRRLVLIDPSGHIHAATTIPAPYTLSFPIVTR